MPEPVAPPSQLIQWTLDDVQLARQQGREADIVQAQKAGQLRDLLAGPTPAPAEADDGFRQLTRADIQSMSPDQIAAADRAGRFDRILRRQPRHAN
jgi:type IV secretory pathway VirJ component